MFKISLMKLSRLNPFLHKRLLSHVLAIAVAIGLLLIIFPDVIFYDASISMNGVYNGANYNIKANSLLPEPTHRAAHHGFYDTGGAVFQSEPMIHFMKDVLNRFESPYWNPYSAAGSLGPETLVDQKFSFITIVIALMGGSDLAFHIFVISFYGLAIYFLYRLLTEYFDLSAFSAIAACIVYMLNGFNIANLNSNVSQIYLCCPLLLFALCAFAKHKTPLRYCLLVAANIIALSTTFFPVSVMVLLVVYIVGMGYTISVVSQEKRAFATLIKFLALQGSTPLLALLFLSFLYLPIIESLSVVDAVEMYNKRFFHAVKIGGLLSVFTPKHFWESYNAMDTIVTSWSQHDPNNSSLNGHVAFHLGIIASIVGIAALTRWKFKQGIIVGSLFFIFILSLGRILGLPLIADGINLVFGLRSIGGHYWWGAVGTSFPFLVAFGLEALREKRSLWLPALILYGIIITSIVYLSNIFGLIEPHTDYRILSLMILGAILFTSLYLFALMKSTSSKLAINILSILFIISIFAELNFYMNHHRYLRTDIFSNPSQEVTFLKAHSGLYRVANIGWFGLTPEYGAAYQIQQIESLNMNILPNYSKFFKSHFLKDPNQRWGDFLTFHNLKDAPQLDLTALDFLAVKYIVVPITFKEYIKFFTSHGYVKAFETSWTIIFENKNVYPRIFAISELIDSSKESINSLRNISLRNIAYTNDSELLTIAKNLGIRTIDNIKNIHNIKKIPDSAVNIISYHHASIKAKANLQQPAVIVLPDNWHPNWKAVVNGQPTYVGIVNESFRGIALSAGEHTIEMHYQPKTMNIALAISLSTFMGLVGIIVFRRKICRWLQ